MTCRCSIMQSSNKSQFPPRHRNTLQMFPPSFPLYQILQLLCSHSIHYPFSDLKLINTSNINIYQKPWFVLLMSPRPQDLTSLSPGIGHNTIELFQLQKRLVIHRGLRARKLLDEHYRRSL